MAVSSARLAVLVVFSCVEMFLYGGLPYGWFSLLFILKDEGVYSNLCGYQTNTTFNNSSDNNSECSAQDQRFNLFFTIGITAMNILNIIAGQLYFRFDVKRIRACSLLTVVAGVLCFGFTSKDIPWLVLPGIILTGIGGSSLHMSNCKVALLLDKGSSVYVGMLGGCLDSSVVTQMIVKALYENGVSRLASYGGVAILCVVISGFGTLIRANDEQSPPGDDRSGDDKPDKDPPSRGLENNNGILDMSISTKETNEDGDTDNTTCFCDSCSTLGSILRSRMFLMHVFWMTVGMLSLFYFIGSVNTVLVQMLDSEEQVSYVTDVMTYTMLGGILTSLVAGYVMEVQKKWFTGTARAVIPLLMTSCMGVLLSSLVFVPSRAGLYAAFVVLTVFRSFLFTVALEFIIRTYPERLMTTLLGIVVAGTGILTMTQYGLFSWMKSYDDANIHVNVVLLCLTVVSILHPILIVVDRKRP